MRKLQRPKKCDSCKGRGWHISFEMHPKGAGRRVPCSKCDGSGYEKEKKKR